MTSASYISTFNILVVAFPHHSLNPEVSYRTFYHSPVNLIQVSQSTPQSKDDTLGLSSWRMLIDHPYYRLTKPDDKDRILSNKRSGWIPLLTGRGGRSVVLKMSVSSNMKYLACMHSCSSVSVWCLPHLSYVFRKIDIFRSVHICSPISRTCCSDFRMYTLRSAQNLPQYDRAVERSENDSPVLMDIGWCLDAVRNHNYLI